MNYWGCTFLSVQHIRVGEHYCKDDGMFFLPPANEDQPSSNDGVSTVPVVVGSVVAVVVISVVVIVILVLVICYRHDKKSLIISKPMRR